MSSLLHRFHRLSTLLPSALFVASAVVAPLASADIYTWTDERGTTVISDTAPKNPQRVTDLQVVVRDGDTGKRTGARKATSTEQKLLERIDTLERQAQAQTYSAPASAYVAPQSPPAVSYYTTPLAPPAYDPYYYESYSGYHPSYYAPAYSYVVPGFVAGRRHYAPGRPYVNPRTVVHRGGGFARGRR